MATCQDNCCGLTLLTTILAVIGIMNVSAAPYYGKRIGTLSSYAHRVAGDVYAASDKRLYLTGFTYDGTAPEPFVWMGNTASASSQGEIIPADGSSNALGSYSNAVVQLDLPGNKTLTDYKWISVWDRRFAANFGDLLFPIGFTAPAPMSLGTLGYSRRVHIVWADDVIILNHRQIKLVSLDYDGNGPDTYYWAGSGDTPTSSGFALADESRGGSLEKLPRQSLNDGTIILTVPANQGDIFSIGHVGLWCVAFAQDFGHVDIPSSPDVPVYDDTPEDINECDSAPCQNGGTCTDGDSGYSCDCSNTGFSGTHCETDINECDSDPCLNGGTCNDGVNAYTCDCYNTGFSGTHCETNINECDSDPCLNGGTCNDGVNAYTCDCSNIGFSGTHCETTAATYYGKHIGTLTSYAHGVRGEVYAASDKRLYITGFYYDGSAPDTFVWMGNTASASSQGEIIPADGSSNVLGSYNNAVVQLDLPGNKTLTDYKWISIWDRRFAANLGDLVFPIGFTAPAPVSLGTLGYSRRVHNVWADDVIILNHRQIKLVNLDYDGNGPDTYYWAGSGDTPTSSGFVLADESRGGSLEKLPRQSLNDVTVILTVLANQGDIFSIGHVGLWCVRFSQDFGHVDIPSSPDVPVYDDGPEDINECDSAPCLNGGTCTDGDSGYSCDCSNTGFSGTRCETDINECDSDPCLNGGTCNDGVNGYTCDCYNTGFSGTHCETNINECDSAPCVNGGTCTDGVNGYTCDCSNTRFSGTHCETTATYYGKHIGTLTSYAHGVRGEVYAASDKRLYITGFYYDGSAPDTFVWMGNTASASSQGEIIPADGSSNVPGSYNNAVVQLDLPGNKTLTDYKWISIWDRRFAANLGDLLFPIGLTAPGPVSLGTLGYSRRVHNVWADDVIILNHRQIKLVNLDYDGNGPDTYYWAGSGGTPTSSGFALADESRGGSLGKLPRQSLTDVTVILTVPANQGDIFSIGHVGLWCVRFTQDFGHVDIPSSSDVPVYDDETGDINECDSDPCLNGGTCNDGVNAYTCDCYNTGFSGTHCETNINECDSDPCLNGGTCNDGVNAYTCDCYNTGFSGTYCETKLCISGGTPFNGYCYKYVSSTKSWPAAQTHCRNLVPGLGNLVSILSENEYNIVENLRGTRQVWIGLNDRDRENTFVWSDGSPLGTVRKWASRQPSKNDCVIQSGKRLGKWKTIPCSRAKRFICKYQIASP
ncbi:uncharacterized protein [Amphiura filiformis]|uniref:uncharacterized protein isoform X2 n=1 Tax=Amphiura filiformis TaxID=82378 RepID=UPI003B2199C3